MPCAFGSRSASSVSRRRAVEAAGPGRRSCRAAARGRARGRADRRRAARCRACWSCGSTTRRASPASRPARASTSSPSARASPPRASAPWSAWPTATSTSGRRLGRMASSASVLDEPLEARVGSDAFQPLDTDVDPILAGFGPVANERVTIRLRQRIARRRAPARHLQQDLADHAVFERTMSMRSCLDVPKQAGPRRCSRGGPGRDADRLRRGAPTPRATAAQGGLSVTPAIVETTARAGRDRHRDDPNSSDRKLRMTVRARPWRQSSTGDVAANRRRTLRAVSRQRDAVHARVRRAAHA